MSEPRQIRPKDRDAILQSLRAGVVPRSGIQHIQVGRVAEVKAAIQDIERIADGGSAIRFVIGEYGSGKTFYLFLVRAVALEKRLVTVHADLNPDRRLHSSNGQARSLYAELMRNMATRARPDGGALPGVVERFVTTCMEDARKKGREPNSLVQDRLISLSELIGGYDFAQVIEAYWRGHDTDNDALKTDAIRWLRGEVTNKPDARRALGVRTIIDDASIYDNLKLLARFVRLAGYAGLLVCLDELVNLYKLASPQARNANYEQILRILNDSLQGISEGLGCMMGGTSEFLLDTRRGLYSYPALASRLKVNAFAVNGLVDYNGPVLRLANLTPEDLYVLLHNVRHVYAGGDSSKYALPDEALKSFMAHCATRLGDSYFRTPRTTITAFVNLLDVLAQNPQVEWSGLVQKVEVAPDSDPHAALTTITDDIEVKTRSDGDDELASFRL